MKIGAIDLEYLPDDCALPRAQKTISAVQTYGGVQVFNWGMMLPGVHVPLSWDLMSTTEFNLLDGLYVQDGTVVWDSGIQGKKYNVSILKFDGKLINGADGEYRQNVEMELVIISEVTT